MSATDRHVKAAALRRENDELRLQRNAGITTNAELLEHIDALQVQLDMTQAIAGELYAALVMAHSQLQALGRFYMPLQETINKYAEWRKEQE